MTSENTYSTNIYKLVIGLLHKALRKDSRNVFVKALVFPLIYISNQFSIYRKAKIYQLLISPQVCYLERMLNDKYDLTMRRIRIDDAVWHLPWFIYQEDELKPQAIYTEAENIPVPLYTDGEAGEALNDFVVLVPMAISFSEPEMRSAIDSYKLFGTYYTIQSV